MMRAIRIVAIVTAAVFTACFGAGPLPTPPTSATAVFSISPTLTDNTNCASYYIGDVALGSDAGYAIAIPYKPQSCGGGGSLGQNLPQPVFRFGKTGDVTMIGSAGTSTGNSEPKIAATGSGAVWAYALSTGNTIQIDPGAMLISIPQSGGPTVGPATLIAATDALYLAAAPSQTQIPPNDPSYPCCNSMQGGGNPGAIQAIATAPAFATITPILACTAANRCLAVNTDNVYYFDQPTGSIGMTSAVEQTTKAGATTTIGQIGMTSTITSPVGIAADETAAVWAASVNYANTSSTPLRGCVISKYDVGGSTTALFTTTRFSCMDIALDGTHIYFAIVSVIGSDSNSQYMRGDGVGRVDRTTGALESLDLGIISPESGPRRVYVDDTDLYLVDPVVIGKIAKTALDGRHDFQP